MAIQPKKKATLKGASLVLTLFEVDGDFEALCAPVRAATPASNPQGWMSGVASRYCTWIRNGRARGGPAARSVDVGC